MKERIIHQDLKLIPYYQNDEVFLAWYQDLDICKQVDNRNKPYDLESLHRMYNYLNTHGECYYIEYKGVLIGDISLRDNSEIAIVISKPYQGKHIGRKCLLEIIKLAKEKGMYKVIANIYSFNRQSQYLFQILGFQKTEDEWYEFIL
ncbi:GNAT family N-acetyltransferase [Bulleidia sp. zg-1006]|uniref:GNAT family N-acetyltransferase n=1 Tax=Bulleidia sp. zg-1006 TaxID=2806552 RepID=UPI00193A0DC2|nr:GNAT family N-acetyltransferase [Bulleidia sp. zg-1006]QRG86220.1 GNAT family N-acetyltransferase [Bulleidia sp. zg-1006]